MSIPDKSTHIATVNPSDQTPTAGVLSDVIAVADALGAVIAKVKECLPASLAPHVRVVCLKEHQLTLAVSSPAWKSRLRMSEQEILDCCRDAGFEVEGIRTLMRYEAVSPPEPKNRLEVTPKVRAAFDELNQLLDED